MIINKLENIENGIIDLLIKKYNVDEYNEDINSFKNNSIDLHILKDQCNVSQHLITKYLEINSKICSYDIDILNLLNKYYNLYKNEIHIKKNEKQEYSLLESIYYYFGYNKPETKTKTIDSDYFIKKSKNLNIKIKDIYLQLFSLFIV